MFVELHLNFLQLFLQNCQNALHLRLRRVNAPDRRRRHRQACVVDTKRSSTSAQNGACESDTFGRFRDDHHRLAELLARLVVGEQAALVAHAVDKRHARLRQRNDRVVDVLTVRCCIDFSIPFRVAVDAV
jgi:hypothetical protein